MTTELRARMLRLSVWVLPLVGALAGCNQKPVRAPQVSVELSQQEGFPKSIRISVHSNSEDPLCVPASEINNGYENLAITQNGKPLVSESASNRAVKLYKGINSLDPMYVVLSGNTDFWYELDDFPIENGKFEVAAHIKMVSCAELFTAADPKWITTSVSKSFDYNPDDV